MVTRRQLAIGTGTGLLAGALGHVGRLNAQGDWVGALQRETPPIEARVEARLGVAVLDTGTDRRMSYRGGERFPMCSTFKTLVAAAVLRRVDAGREDLSRRVRFEAGDLVTYSPVTKDRVRDGMTVAELCEATTTLSDNTAANLLLKTIGGPQAVTALARSVGDAATRLDRWETALNEAKPGDPQDTTTPDAMATTLRALAVDDGLSPSSRDQLAAWLVANKTGDAKLRAGLPKDWRIGDKTGSGGNGTTNDIAILWPPRRAPIVVTVYMTETIRPMAETNAAFAEIGRMVASALGA